MTLEKNAPFSTMTFLKGSLPLASVDAATVVAEVSIFNTSVALVLDLQIVAFLKTYSRERQESTPIKS